MSLVKGSKGGWGKNVGATTEQRGGRRAGRTIQMASKHGSPREVRLGRAALRSNPMKVKNRVYHRG